MEKDKGHLVNIEKVEINNIYTNHIDTAEILSMLNVLKLQNRKILEKIDNNENEEELKTEIMQKLNKAIGDIKSTI